LRRRPRPEGRADGGISRVPRASRPCMPTAEAPVDADPLWPERAVAGAFPVVAYGSASTVFGISGLVPFIPACVADFGLQDSCLRFVRTVTRQDARLGPSDRVARPSPVGLPVHSLMHESPTGKRRLGPAHATSPCTSPCTTSQAHPPPERSQRRPVTCYPLTCPRCTQRSSRPGDQQRHTEERPRGPNRVGGEHHPVERGPAGLEAPDARRCGH